VLSSDRAMQLPRLTILSLALHAVELLHPRRMCRGTYWLRGCIEGGPRPLAFRHSGPCGPRERLQGLGGTQNVIAHRSTAGGVSIYDRVIGLLHSIEGEFSPRGRELCSYTRTLQHFMEPLQPPVTSSLLGPNILSKLVPTPPPHSIYIH
jgi:hypothetical protein